MVLARRDRSLHAGTELPFSIDTGVPIAQITAAAGTLFAARDGRISPTASG
jgi:hypothetical protein